MNSHQRELVTKIQSTVAASPELQKQLVAATSAEQVASLLASAMGSTVTADDLRQINAAVASEISDEQLEAVAAGANGQLAGLLIFASLVTWGTACALGSAISEIAKGSDGCKNFFNG
jgi:predicted ribosomally synthesized peptide with nif11-like leader